MVCVQPLVTVKVQFSAKGDLAAKEDALKRVRIIHAKMKKIEFFIKISLSRVGAPCATL
jgi:hypothetical protein